MAFVTRFAPSPTGPLHLGHAYSAMLAHDMARAAGGTFLLRIEDTDPQRSRPEWEAAIFDDLGWLGLDWPRPVRRQSEHAPFYAGLLDRLTRRGLIYGCRCTRADIRAALSAPQEGAPAAGPDGPVYPGTCRGRGLPLDGTGLALRLDMARALDAADPERLTWQETGHEEAEAAAPGRHRIDPERMLQGVGDVVLGRREAGTVAYHLAVVADDAAQGVTRVVRGADLAEATAIHVLLQALLDLPTPVYHHHRLIRDETGKRLAKRDDARAIARYRADGASPQDIRRMVGLPPPP
ncbi:MAG: tRNA glutamyl-Q(34) synthetase GluQRS [Tranquillimonas sp.]